MLEVLEQIGFVDSSRVPGEPWQKYRGGDYKRVLGNAIRSGYGSYMRLTPTPTRAA